MDAFEDKEEFSRNPGCTIYRHRKMKVDPTHEEQAYEMMLMTTADMINFIIESTT